MNRYASITLKDWNDEGTGLSTDDLAEMINDVIIFCKENNETVLVVEVVRVVSPAGVNIVTPNWDSAARPAPAPEAYEVGERVEVMLDGSVWVPADIMRLGISGNAWTSYEYGGSEFRAWFSPDYIRHPVTAAPALFVFGQQVKACRNIGGQDFSEKKAVYLSGPDEDGHILCSVDGNPYNVKHFGRDQVFPL